MTRNKERNQSMGADPELTRVLALADKDVKTVVITAFHALTALKGAVADGWG